MLERLIASYLAVAVVTFIYCVITGILEIREDDFKDNVSEALRNVGNKRPDLKPYLEIEGVIKAMVVFAFIYYVVSSGCVWPKFVYSTIKRVMRKASKKD